MNVPVEQLRIVHIHLFKYFATYRTRRFGVFMFQQVFRKTIVAETITAQTRGGNHNIRRFTFQTNRTFFLAKRDNLFQGRRDTPFTRRRSYRTRFYIAWNIRPTRRTDNHTIRGNTHGVNAVEHSLKQ